jgi:hypothetical protein
MSANRRLDLLTARKAALGKVGPRSAAVDANPKAAPLTDPRRIPDDDVACRRRLDRLDNGLGQALMSGRMSLSYGSLLDSG